MRRQLALLCSAQFVAVLDANAVLVALPLIGRELGVRGAGLQWVVTAYVLPYAGCLLAGGRVADRCGRRRVFGVGIGLFTAASLACGLAPGIVFLVAARAAQGLAAALIAPAALAMLVEAFREGPERERAVAVWTAVAAVGGASGLMLGGVVTAALGWRWVFLINVPVGLATLVLAPRLLAESRSDPRPVDLPGALAATAGLGLLVLALAGTPVALPPAVLALGAFVVRQRRAAHPLVAPALLRSRRLVTALLTAAVLTAATSGGAVLATLHLQDALGLGPAGAALRLLPLSVAVVAGSIAAQRTRLAVRTVIGGGLALVAAGSALAAVSLSAPGVMAWAVLAGFGLGAASVAATTLGTSAGGEKGTVAGLLSTAAQVGTALGVAALVPLGSARAGFAAAALLSVLAAAPARWRPRAGARSPG